MGFWMIAPKRVRKVKSKGAQEAIDRLEKFLKSTDVTGEPVEILCGFWKDQQTAITYQEIREAVKEGYISNETFCQWEQDYSNLVKAKLNDVWENAMKEGATKQPLVEAIAGGFTFNTQSPGILSWLEQKGAEFVTSCTRQQKDAIAALLSKKMIESHTVDELARMIRPCIGLTESDAKAASRFYDNIVATMKKEHPRMKPESIRKKALDATQKYAEKKHRARAMTIAQTESAFAYNRGADEGIRQAQGQNLIGTVKKRFSTSGDDAVCELCASLEGMEVDMDSDFNIGGRLLFSGQHMLPPVHPRCACAVEYIEVQPPVFQQEVTYEESINIAQQEYESHFEGQRLDKETYIEAASGMAELGFDINPERVVEMVNSVNTYTGGDFTDILAAQTNYTGRFTNYGSIMSEERKASALLDVKNIEEFIENSPAYEGKVFRGLGFDVGGPMDQGDYESFRELYKKGAIVETDTFTSWTKSEDFLSSIHSARTFVDEECEYAVEVTIRMKNCETGIDISKYAEIEGQQEVLFDKTSLKVKDIVEKWKDDETLQIFIDVEELW